VTYLDSEWAINPVVRRDVMVAELLSSLGGDAFPDRRDVLVNLLDIDQNWHMHAVSDGTFPLNLVINRGTSSSAIGNGFIKTLESITFG
jgi:hypothetical protein